VGTDRQAIAIEVGANGEGMLLGPDNGLLAPAVAISGGAGRAFALTNTAYHLPSPGPTFAGRDVFAPVAAHLCNGVPLEELGTEIDADLLMPGLIPLSRDEDGKVMAEVLWVDRFGNCQLNVDPDDLAPLGDQISLRLGATVRAALRVTTYGDLRPGQVGLLVDSYGLVSIATDRSSAAEALGLRAGAAVVLDVAR
jgi:S-adenosylmethionine hydrolase